MLLRKFFFTCATGAAVFALSSSAANAVPAAPTVIKKSCTSRYAARAVAESLATNIRNAFAADVTSGAITKPNVAVRYSERGVGAKVEVDFAKEITFQVTSAPVVGKIEIQGAPTAATLYEMCTPPVTLFTVLINYQWIDKTNNKKTPIAIRQTLELTLPGQYL